MKITSKKKQVFSTKKHLNLMQREKSSKNSPRVVVFVLLLLVLVFSILKFGVFDRMYSLYSANSDLGELEKQLQDAMGQTKNYDEVYDTYSRYTYSGFTDAEMAGVNRLDAIGLIDTYILTTGKTSAYTIIDNVISLSLSGVSLDQTSELLNRLYSNSMVESVVVSTAGADTGTGARVNMTLTLKKVGEI